MVLAEVGVMPEGNDPEAVPPSAATPATLQAGVEVSLHQEEAYVEAEVCGA